MSGFWVSQEKHWCEYCRTFTQGDPISIRMHEGGKRHKENVAKFLAEQQRDKVKQSMKEADKEAILREIDAKAAARMAGASYDGRVPPAPPLPPPRDGPGGPSDPRRASVWGPAAPPTLPDRFVPASARGGLRRAVLPPGSAHPLGPGPGDAADDGAGPPAKRPRAGAPPAEEAGGGGAEEALVGVGLSRSRFEEEEDGEAFLRGAGAGAYLRTAGSRCEVRSLVYPGGAGSGSEPVEAWERGELVRVVPPGAGLGRRFMVRVSTTVRGADGSEEEVQAVREADEGGVRLRLGPVAEVSQARGAGVDPAAVASAPAKGSSGRGEESGWRAVSLAEAVDRARASRPVKEEPTDGDESPDDGGGPGQWQTVAVREVSAAQAEEEAAAAVEGSSLGVDELVKSVMAGGGGAAPGDHEERAQADVYKGVALANGGGGTGPAEAEAGAAGTLEDASQAVAAAGFKRRRNRAAGNTRRRRK